MVPPIPGEKKAESALEQSPWRWVVDWRRERKSEELVGGEVRRD